MNETLLLRQLLGGGQGWVSAALLICLFLVVLWRPDRIRNYALFRQSGVLLALSLMVPSLLAVLIGLIGGASLYGFSSSGMSVFMALTGASGPVLLGLSVIFGLFSLGPGRTFERPEPRDPKTPRRHPLEPQ